MRLLDEVKEKGVVRVEWKKGNPVVNWTEHRNILRIIWNILIVWATTYAPIGKELDLQKLSRYENRRK